MTQVKTGRERMTIRFLAGQQPAPGRSTTSSSGERPALHRHVRRQAPLHFRRPFLRVPSMLSPGGRLSRQATVAPGLPDLQGRFVRFPGLSRKVLR